jgi:hypothetical protein
MSRYNIILLTFKHAGEVTRTATSKKSANAEFDLLAEKGAHLMKLGRNDTALVRIYDSKSKQRIKIIREAEVTTEGVTESKKDKYK